MNAARIGLLSSAALFAGADSAHAATQDQLYAQCVYREPSRAAAAMDWACRELIARGWATGASLAADITNYAIVPDDKGEQPSMLGEYERALLYDHYNPRLLTFASGVAQTHRKVDLALTLVNKAIGLDPSLTIAYEQRGNIFYQTGDYERSVADFTSAYRVSGNAFFLVDRAEAYELMGDFTRALADYDAAAAAQPNTLNTMQYACLARAWRGVELDRATHYCEAALRLYEANASLDAMGLIAYRRHRYEEAVRWFDRAITKSDLPTYRYERGMALRRLGRAAQGDAEINAAVVAWAGVVEWVGRYHLEPTQ